MMGKGLAKEFIATLLQKKGLGPKTVLKIAEEARGIETPRELYNYVSSRKEKSCRNITLEEVLDGYERALYTIERSEDLGIGLIGYFDEEFPESLRNCVDEEGKHSPPLLLYYRGNLRALEMPGVAIIGTREPTKEGVHAGEFFGEEFAKYGFNIVSGLAVGCDTAAHRGALKGYGVTTAFLAHGLDWDSIYPKENLELAEQIVQSGGLLLSEYEIGVPVSRYSLVARDRLQAGLANGTIVIQTGVKGGTMHAVNATLAACKVLYAVEYASGVSSHHEKIQGNLLLIEQGKAKGLGSKMVASAVEVLGHIGQPVVVQGELEFAE